MTRREERFKAPYERYSGVYSWRTSVGKPCIMVSEGSISHRGSSQKERLKTLWRREATKLSREHNAMAFELPKEFLE